MSNRQASTSHSEVNLLSHITELEGGDPHYRAFLIDLSGCPVQVLPIVAPDDAKAVAQATALVDGRGVDLWDGIRFIEHFPAVDPQT
jgi:ferritin-like protein